MHQELYAHWSWPTITGSSCLVIKYWRMNEREVSQSLERRTELFFLIARFLEESSCKRAAKVLKEELEEKELLASGKEWTGEDKKLSFEEISVRNGHISSDYLSLLCGELCTQLESAGHVRTVGQHSLIGNEISSFIYKNNNIGSSLYRLTNQRHDFTTDHLQNNDTLHHYTLLCSSHLSPVPSLPSLLQQPNIYTNMKKHRVILGHLAPVFCLSFDSTGERIITGADDDLAKVWCSRTGQLITTLRGHHAELTDVSISWDNTMIATGSLDKLVRVWCGQTSAPLAVLSGHSGHITSVQLSPSPDEENKFIATTAKDGCLLFWKWDPNTLKFHEKPLKYMEKNRVSDQTLCSAFSPGGKFYVTGGTDKIVRVYQMLEWPVLMRELSGHNDRIMTIQFSNTGQCCFATGSCDGTAIIWQFRSSQWSSTVLVANLDKKYMSEFITMPNKPDKALYSHQVTMICWERLTDSYLVTAHTPDCCIRIWRTTSGEQVSLLKGHTNEVFVVECHPKEPRVLLTAGHDGQVIIWDMFAAVKLKVFQIKYEEEGVPCIFDCKWSPDGLTCAAADSFGYMTIFGFGSSTPYEQHPEEQFFHTDYRPLIRDRNHYVVDEQTLLPPHLLPPPYLVDIDGHPYPAKQQECILKHIRTAKSHSSSTHQRSEDTEDYDEYMRKHFAKFEEKERKTFQERNKRTAPPTATPINIRSTPSLLGEEVAAPTISDTSNASPQDKSVVEEVVDVMESDEREQNIQNMLSSIVYSLGLDEGEALVAISNWHKRNILPPLDSSIISSEQARLYELREEEDDWFERESNKIQELPTPSPPVPTPQGRSLRSGRTIETREEDEDEEEEGVRGGTPPVHEGDSDSDAIIDEAWDTGSTASSDISDWTNEAGYNPSLSHNRARRTRRRQSTLSEIPSEMTIDEEEEEQERENERRRRKRRSEVLSSSTSTDTQQPVTIKKPTIKIKKGHDYTVYWPPEWLKMKSPQISPYFPQVGDIVVYCYQGHIMYRDEVKKQKPYMWKNQLLPHQRYPQIRAQEFCLVKNVHFVVGPPTLCSITLTLLSSHSSSSELPSTRSNQPIKFTFKYHDMDDVVDFLILDTVYKKSIQTQWRAGSRFKSMIDNSYYTGTVIKREPHNSDLPHSYWQCYQVRWDDGPTDRLSPWDMESPTSSPPPSPPLLSLSASASESMSWGGEGERERILRGLEKMMEEMEEAEMFKCPVNLEEETVYCTVVPFPTDLSTICHKLRNGFYRRKLALIWEVILLSRNASAYNEADSTIVRHSKVLTQTLLKFINTPGCTDPMTCYTPQEIRDDNLELVTAPEVDLDADSEVFLPVPPPPAPPLPVSPSLRPVRQTRMRTKRLISDDDENVESSDDKSWIISAERLLEEICSHPDSYPFIEPVDLSCYPNYSEVIKEPMDLSTVQDKLCKGDYENSSYFLKDMNLIFNNAKDYNQTRSQVYKMANSLQILLNDCSKSYLGVTPDHTHHYNTRRALEKIAGSLNSIEDTPTFEIPTPTSEPEEEEGAVNNNHVDAVSDVTSERRSDTSYYSREEEEEEEEEEDGEEEEVGEEEVAPSQEGGGDDGVRVTRSRSKLVIKSSQNFESEEEEEEEERERRSSRRKRKRKRKGRRDNVIEKQSRKKRRKRTRDVIEEDPLIRVTRAGRVSYQKQKYS